jgi:hypothetical protein
MVHPGHITIFTNNIVYGTQIADKKLINEHLEMNTFITNGFNTLFCSPSLFYLLVHSRCRGFIFSLDHTQTHTSVSRTPLDEGSAHRRDLYLTTQTLYKRQTSMPLVGFDPSKRTAADLRLRPRGHWDQQM